MSAPAAAGAADLVAGSRRPKSVRVRALAPDVLQTAKVRRWTPDEVLRTLVEADITARDESNHRARLKTAWFPVPKLLDELKVTQSSVSRASRHAQYQRGPPVGPRRGAKSAPSRRRRALALRDGGRLRGSGPGTEIPD